MSGSDLRPEASRKTGSSALSLGSLSMPQFLRTKVGALVTILFVGFFAGVVASAINGTIEGKIAPTEGNQSRLAAAVGPAVEAFYREPSDLTESTATTLIKNYRSSFPDALSDTLQAPSEKVICYEALECRTLNNAKRNGYAERIKSISIKYAKLPLGSPEFNASVSNEKAFDRVLPVEFAINDIKNYRGKFDASKNAEGTLRSFSAALDGVLARNPMAIKDSEVRDLMSMYVSYTVSAQVSLKPFYFQSGCSPDYESLRPYSKACEDAVGAYKAAIRQIDRQVLDREIAEKKNLSDERTRRRLSAVKTMIVERAAPRNFVQQQLSNVLLNRDSLFN